jgi:predicted permease
MVIMISAGLLAKSFYRMLHEDMGLVPDHLAVVRVLDPNGRIDAQHIALGRQVLFRMAALPGVTSVGISEELAVEGGERFKSQFAHYRVFGRPYVGQGKEALDERASVGYFETLRARLKGGRYFTEADDTSSRPVAIINQTMANENFPGEDPIGKRVVNEYNPDHPAEVVGVIDDLKDGPLDMKPTPSVYSPFNQVPSDRFYVTIRTSGSDRLVLHSMLTTIRAIDPGLVADREGTMSDRIDNSQSAYLQRSAALLVASFAVLALVLATVGLYGVVSYSVSRRTREIGVRIALGAQRSSVYRLILQEAAWLAIAGVAGGVICSLVLGGLLRSLLYGVSPWDITTQISVAGVLIAATFIASYIPARRAASVLPTEALRAE